MLYLVIFLFLIILLFVLFSRVDIYLRYNHSGGTNHIFISISVFRGLVRIPASISKKNKKINKNYKKLWELREKYLNYRAFFVLAKDLINLLKEKLIVKKVIAELEVGTGDAAQSGIVSGLAWTLLGNLMSIFTNVFKTCRFRYNVKTNFSKAVFNMDFFCIFSIKIVNIIVVGMRLAVLFLKNRDKLKKATGGDMFGGTSDSRSYDYSDAEHQGHG